MTESELRSFLLHDVIHTGLRLTVGVLFIVHSLGKFEPGFAQVLPNMGLPPELQFPIALAELVPGFLLIFGVLSRFGGAVLSVVMFGAIFYVHKATSLTGDDGVEFALVLLVASLLIMIAGPGRISIAHVAKKIPRVCH